MYKHDEETKKFLAKAKLIFEKEMSNIEHILSEYEQFEDNEKSISSYLAVNIFAPMAEMLVLQILENLEKGFLLIAIIGLRGLVENYFNVHYIFHHPEHLNDNNWANKLCKDYMERSESFKAKKSKLGEVSLYKRAKSVGLEEFYKVVYSGLCNYSHFLAKVVNVTHPAIYKGTTIETAVHDITCYQDILATIAMFFSFSFDDYTKEIFEYHKEGEQILASINFPQ